MARQLKLMSRAKEYIESTRVDKNVKYSDKQIWTTKDVYDIIEFHCKESVNQSLEDIKEEAMLKSKYLEFRGVVIYMEDLDKILEKLKL